MGRGGSDALRPRLGGAHPRVLRRLRIRAHRPGPAAQYLHGVAAVAGEPEETRGAPRERTGFRDEPRQGGRGLIFARLTGARAHSGLIWASRASFAYFI